MPVFQPIVLGFIFATGMKAKPASITGKYASLVTGLKLIECQLCAPPGPGTTTAGLPDLS